MGTLEKSKGIAKVLDEKYGTLEKDDFWLLERSGKSIAWIIKHIGVLKIAREESIKLNPDFYEIYHDDKQGSIVMFYKDVEKGIFEVGEVNPSNCRNDYPYAMCLKRLQDRVILKLTGLAEQGAYSEGEAHEFEEDNKSAKETKKEITKKTAKELLEEVIMLGENHEILVSQYIQAEFKKTELPQLNETELLKVKSLLGAE